MSKTKEVVMNFAGDPQVLVNIKKKKELMDMEDSAHNDIRSVLICPGGGQRGVITGGVGTAIDDLGLNEAFYAYIGCSSGIAVAWYTLDRKARLGTSIYYQENIDDGFVNLARFWKIIDIDNLEKVLRFKKPIDVDTFRVSAPQVWVSLTDWETGEGLMVDIKTLPDPAIGAIGSMCLPIYSGNKKVEIDGKKYVDGSHGNPLPISFAIEELGATDVLVAMTSPLKLKSNSFIETALYRAFAPNLTKSLEDYPERYNQELAYLTGERLIPEGVRVAAIYPDQMPITKVCTDRALLMQGAMAAEEFTRKLFTEN